MLLIPGSVDLFPAFGMKPLPRPTPDVAVEFYVRRIKLLLLTLKIRIETRDQSRYLIAIELAVVIVQVVKIGRRLVLGFIIASLDSPHVSPVRRRRMVG